jgi:hypothetical protein
LLLPIVYNDLRFTDIKPDVQKLVMELSKIGNQDEEGIADLMAEKERLIREEKVREAIKRNSNINTPQHIIEDKLIDTLERYWPGFRERGNLVSKAEVIAKSFVTRITGSFMERVAPDVQDSQKIWNMRALTSLINIAKKDGTKILLYRQPHRPNQRHFYHDRTAYDNFFREVQNICREKNLYCADYEVIVNEKYYGYTNEGREDCFHFQSEGHKILATAVESLISTYERH